MASDTPIPLATPAQMAQGAFADLVRGYSPPDLADLMYEATRACETECGRRLAPFTITESFRAEGIDPDEYGDTTSVPLDFQGTTGQSYALALGAQQLVRHVWVNQYPPHFPDLWTYSNVSIEIVRSYGGTQTVPASQITGPEMDGHIRFQLGTFLPIGSLIRPTYSGGYTTSPRDLVRGCKYMAASIAVTELDPMMHGGHDAETLEAKAVAWLSPYARVD